MIQINIARISPDSKFLELDLLCPADYYFNKLYIKKYDFIPLPSTTDEFGNTVEDDGWRDWTTLLSQNTTNEILRIETQLLCPDYTLVPDNNGNTCSTMFYIQVGVIYDGIITPAPSLADVVCVCSDVNRVYDLLKDMILNLDTLCITESKYLELLRNYQFLFAHIKAMENYRSDEAELFYDLIKKSFASCSTLRSNTNRTLSSCNCN